MGHAVLVDGPVQVVIGAERKRVALTVLGRMHPGSTDYWDGNWLLSPIEVGVGAFSGRVEAALRADELYTFRRELEKLYETLSGEARLESIEDWIGLSCVGDGLGHIEVTGYVRDEPGLGNELSFKLSLDQTFLPGIIADLRELEAAYPVLGKR